MGMQGDADTLSLSYQLNILRSRMANNYVGLRYDYKWLRNNYDSFNWQGRKTSGAVVLETHGDWQDRSHLGLAQNNYSLSYTYGDITITSDSNIENHISTKKADSTISNHARYCQPF